MRRVFAPLMGPRGPATSCQQRGTRNPAPQTPSQENILGLKELFCPFEQSTETHGIISVGTLQSSSPSFDGSPREEKRGKWDHKRLSSSRKGSCKVPLSFWKVLLGGKAITTPPFINTRALDTAETRFAIIPAPCNKR